MGGTWPSENATDIVYSGAFANIPSAATFPGKYAEITNFGGAILLRSDGTNWRPENGSITLLGCKYPSAVAPTGSVTASGSGVTLGTALPLTFNNGIWLYINATSGLTAGWYFAIMSSTTQGVLYGTAQSYINNSPSATPTTIPSDSAFTGEINEVSAWRWTVPAGFLLPGARISADTMQFRNSGGGTSVQCNLKLGATQMASGSVGVANQSARYLMGFTCLTSSQQVRGGSTQITYSNSASAIAFATENTAAEIDLTVTLYHPTTATDYSGLSSIVLRIEM